MWGAVAKGALTILAWVGVDLAIDKWIIPVLSNVGGKSRNKSDESIDSIKKDLESDQPDVQARAFTVVLLTTLADVIQTMEPPIEEVTDSNRQLREEVCASLSTDPNVCLEERTGYASALVDGSEECESAALAEMYVRYSEEQGVQIVTAVNNNGEADVNELSKLFANSELYCPDAFSTCKRALLSYEIAMSALPSQRQSLSSDASAKTASQAVGSRDEVIVDDPLSFAYAGKYVDKNNITNIRTSTPVADEIDSVDDDIAVNIYEEDEDGYQEGGDA